MFPHLVRLTVVSAALAGVSLAMPFGKHGTSLYARLTPAPGSSSISLNDSLNVPLNSPGVIQRSMCVAVGLSRRAAYQCGDLALSYELPAVRVLGKTTAPTLLYHSGVAFPFPLITLDAKLASGVNVPDSIGYTVNVNGTDRKTEVLKTGLSAWADNARRRIQVGWDAKADPTDVYNVKVRVNTYYPAGVSFADSVSTETIVVNRNYSPLGLGWWIGGVEQVFIPSNNANNRLWVAGDGSARIYRATGTANVWVADAFDRPDTLTYASSQYTRKVPGGAVVKFNAQGQHITTTDARGYATTFNYLSSTAGAPVTSIKLPKLDSLYRFKYKLPGVDTSALDTIYSPNATTAGGPAPARKTIVKSYVRVLYQFFDPKGADEYYEIGGAGGGAGRIIFRREKGGTESVYTYDDHAQLTQAHVDSVVQAKTVICPFFTVNNPIASCGTRILRATDAEITVDGPLPNSPAADIWAYRVHRFGAPELIRDPKGNLTRIFRQTGTCGNPPAFVNKVIAPSGQETIACPDARGNVQYTTTYDATAPGMIQTTYYLWDARWDKVTQITRNSETEFIATYDAVGNPDSIADSRANSATRFYYYGAGANANLLNVVKAPARRGLADDFEFITYDALGNPNGVYEYSDSVGTATRPNSGMHYNQDAIGRNIQTCIDIDSLQLTIPPQSCTYYTLDPLGRDSVTIQYVPKYSGPAAQSWVVRKYFGNENEVVGVSRERGGSDTVHFTHYAYDRFGRKTKDSIPGFAPIRYAYDKAGNMTSTTNRRGQTVTMTYNEMNQLVQKVVPAVTIDSVTPSSSVGFATSPKEPYPWKSNNAAKGYTMPAETFNFTYDVMGRMLTATNNDSEVRRTYYLNGLLNTDSLYIRAASGGFLKYGLKNRYDFYDRRTSILLDATLRNGATRDSIGFQYYPTSNELLQVTDPMGNAYAHLYNRRSELVELQMPGSVNETFKYDAVGNILRDTVTTSAGTVRASRFTYDNRHKVRTTDDATGFQERNRFTYSGLGYLTSSEIKSSTAGGSVVSLTRETMTYDNLGTMLTTFTEDSLKTPSGTTKQSWNGTHYLDKDWRLASSAPGGGLGLRDYTYDADWNVTFYRQALSGGYQEDRVSYYDAENRLRAADYRKGNSAPPQYFARKVFEQYRYDALGRRIWVRADKDCNASAFPTIEALCDVSTLRRTIWDGDRELFEVQVPVKILGDVDQSNAVLDNDLYNASMPRGPNGGDANPYFGRVLYVNGLTLDKPLGIVRFNYSDVDPNVAPDTNHFFMPVAAMTLLWDQKGKVADVVCSTGVLRCAGTRNGGTAASLRVDIPEKFFVVERTGLFESTWQGTLLTDKGDAARTNYRRNRYYDPTSGRFTQADPIGLAGGLNLYGYGDGDALNNSDPYGLCPVGGANVPCAAVGLLAGSVVGGIGGGIAATVCAVGTGGICAAGSPLLVTGGAGIGGTIGTLIGGVFDAPFAYKEGGRFTPKSKTIIDREATEATGQEGTCEYCGIETDPKPGSRRSKQFDHLEPRSKGGSNDPVNGRRSCASCNQGYGDKYKPDPRRAPEE